MSGLVTESAFQIASKQVFAGKRAKVYIDSFHKHMRTDKPSSLLSGLTLPALAEFYRNLKNDLLKKVENGIMHGTVEWRNISTLTPVCHGDVSNTVVRETAR